MSTARAERVRSGGLVFRDSWPLFVGFAALAIPTVISLADKEWTRDYGGHEPIVVAVSAWLIWRLWRLVRVGGGPRRWAPAAALLLIGLPTYVFGRAYDFLTLEAAGLYCVGVALLYASFGFSLVRKLWFPILFLIFAIPPPHALVDELTAPLKELVSHLATSGLSLMGLPVARQGVIIFIAQYELLVEDACSGMNSLIGLTALSLLYGYFARGPSLANSIFMLCLAVPVAVAANVVRVALLVLITYSFGDAAAQSFLHFAAGIFLFVAALTLVFVVDRAAHATLSFARRA